METPANPGPLEILRTVLLRYGVNNPQLWTHLLQVIEVREYARDQHLVRAGETPAHFFVILSGLVRYYYSSPEGKEWNKAFFREGEVVGSLSAYLRQQPCAYSIEVMEPSLLASVPLHILTQSPCGSELMQGMLDRITREIMLRNEAREALLLTCSSKARYRWLLEHESWLLKRVPQYHLATYLSMDAVSFSRAKRTLDD